MDSVAEEGSHKEQSAAPPPVRTGRSYSNGESGLITGTVRVLLNVLQAKAPVVAAHGRRTAGAVRQMGEHLRLDDETVNQAAIAALLHDLGIVELSDSSLTSLSTRMSGEDRSRYLRHPETGQAFLQPMRQLEEVGRIIRAHHERWDGTGFPDRCIRDEIPLAARLLSIADDFDRVQLGLFHGAKLKREGAVEFIKEGSGIRYDPDVVEGFLSLFGANGTKPKAVQADPYRLEDLRPGMVVGCDVQTNRGLLLLGNGFVLDQRIIENLSSFNEKESGRLVVYIRRHSRGGIEGAYRQEVGNAIAAQ